MDKINFIVRDNENTNFELESKGIIKVYPPLDDIAIIPTKETQTFKNLDKYGYDVVKVESIPEEYIKPEGVLSVTSNGLKDVKDYASVMINVDVPDGYIIPTGNLNIKENGVKDVSTFASVNVNVRPEVYLQNKEVTPSKEEQIIKCDDEYHALDIVQVNPIPDEYIIPKLQDIEVECIKNGEHTIVADSGYDGINSVFIKTNVKGGGSEEDTEDPDYIKDGLIAWFEGEDDLIGNKLINRVGSDNIYLMTTTVGVRAPSYNPFTKALGTKGISNNMSNCYITSKDYYKTGYTYEAVGEITNTNNSTNNSGGWLFASNNTAAFGIGVSQSTGEVYFINSSNVTKEKTYKGYYGKRFGASIYTKQVFTRDNSTGIYDVDCSVDGKPYHNIKQTTESTRTSKYNGLTILGYYCFNTSGDKYAVNGHLYSFRIYNRKLTEEEIAHNHEIDKRRFKLHDYVEE